MFYMVLAVGHWLSAPEKELFQAPFYSAARSLFTIKLLEAGTLGTVQALLLMVGVLESSTLRIFTDIQLKGQLPASEALVLSRNHR